MNMHQIKAINATLLHMGLHQMPQGITLIVTKMTERTQQKLHLQLDNTESGCRAQYLTTLQEADAFIFSLVTSI